MIDFSKHTKYTYECIKIGPDFTVAMVRRIDKVTGKMEEVESIRQENVLATEKEIILDAIQAGMWS